MSSVDGAPVKWRIRWVALVAVALGAVACGGGGDDGGSNADSLVDAGQIELDADAVTTTTVALAGDGVGGAAESGDTIPLNPEEAEDSFYGAVDEFMGCMQTQAGGFIGVPDFGDEPDMSLPRNADEYRTALGTCAAQSNIMNSMNAAEDAIANMTQNELESRNRAFLGFRDCMIGRGWGIPEPTPDDNGLLFGEFFQALDWEPPAGENLDSNDLDDCNLTGLASPD